MLLQNALDVEMAEPGEAPPGGASNARNGAYDKLVAERGLEPDPLSRRRPRLRSRAG